MTIINTDGAMRTPAEIENQIKWLMRQAYESPEYRERIEHSVSALLWVLAPHLTWGQAEAYLAVTVTSYYENMDRNKTMMEALIDKMKVR